MRRRNFLLFLAQAAGLGVLARQAHARQSRRLLLQTSPLAGFQYHEGKAVWPMLARGDALSLVREPENVHDAKAVRVDWRGHKLGYVPRSESHAVAQMLDRGERLEARIERLAQSRDPWERVEMGIHLAIRSASG